MTGAWIIVMTRVMEHSDDKLVQYFAETACNTGIRSVMEHSDGKNLENCDDQGMEHCVGKTVEHCDEKTMDNCDEEQHGAL